MVKLNGKMASHYVNGLVSVHYQVGNYIFNMWDNLEDVRTPVLNTLQIEDKKVKVIVEW